MTIEDVREDLISILTEIEITGGSMVTSIYKDELKIAIDTMRKYQKIQEIYLKWNRNYEIQTSSAWTEMIEVLEDGNNR